MLAGSTPPRRSILLRSYWPSPASQQYLQVADPLGIDSHGFHANAVGRHEVRRRDRHAGGDGGSSQRALALHAFEAIDHGGAHSGRMRFAVWAMFICIWR